VLILGDTAAKDSSETSLTPLRTALLSWYGIHRRDLPWRRTQDPYAIWISEIMLQQTRVAAVIEKYELFLSRFPTVHALAEAAEQDVLAVWSGLGYYRRARMMHLAAKRVVLERGGKMPGNAAGLRTLPGIGAYTSAAIASIAFGEPVAVVDGNVERVVQRLAGWGSSAAEEQTELVRLTWTRAAELLDRANPGDFNQAMMELGATVCLPKNPTCLMCPLREFCQTQGEHPTQTRAKMRSQQVACALVVRGNDAQSTEVLLVQRPTHETVMTGMWELPMLKDSVVPEDELIMTVRHAIMQVNYVVNVRSVAPETLIPCTEAMRWVKPQDLDTLALTGLARKILKRAKLL
jgi:A/G-specific adenine glycosylase